MKFNNKENIEVNIDKNARPPFYEYVMSGEMANAYLENRNHSEKSIPWRQYLANVVNNEFGIFGTCAAVAVE